MSCKEEYRNCPVHGRVIATVTYADNEHPILREVLTIECPKCTKEAEAMTFPDIEDTTRQDSFPLPRRFYLERSEDMTGVSGTGVVALGVRFPDGRVALQWVPPGNDPANLTEAESDDQSREIRATSMVMWDDTEAMMAVHGHHNLTALKWID